MSTTKESAFDDIRPYRDDEIPAAMQRIAASEFFPLLATYIFPDEELESVRERVMQIRTSRLLPAASRRSPAKGSNVSIRHNATSLFRITATLCSMPRCCSICSS